MPRSIFKPGSRPGIPVPVLLFQRKNTLRHYHHVNLSIKQCPSKKASKYSCFSYSQVNIYHFAGPADPTSRFIPPGSSRHYSLGRNPGGPPVPAEKQLLRALSALHLKFGHQAELVQIQHMQTVDAGFLFRIVALAV